MTDIEIDELIVKPTFNFSVRVEIYYANQNVMEDNVLPFNVQYVHFDEVIATAVRRIGSKYYFHRITDGTFTIDKFKKRVEEKVHLHQTHVKVILNESEREFHIKTDKQLHMFLENATENEVGWRYSIDLQTKNNLKKDERPPKMTRSISHSNSMKSRKPSSNAQP